MLVIVNTCVVQSASNQLPAVDHPHLMNLALMLKRTIFQNILKLKLKELLKICAMYVYCSLSEEKLTGYKQLKRL